MRGHYYPPDKHKSSQVNRFAQSLYDYFGIPFVCKHRSPRGCGRRHEDKMGAGHSNSFGWSHFVG